MSNWDLLLIDVHLATMREGGAPYGVVADGALAIADGRIAWLGPLADLPASSAPEQHSLGGRWITPALIDCHTHLVFAGSRAAEFEQRLQGVSYEEIAAAGGGIMSTVLATRDADLDTLIESSGVRLKSLRNEGVATVEIKSGYGLDLDTEIKMLEVARSLGASQDLTVATTFLGAHATPPEFTDRDDDYIRFLIDDVLPARQIQAHRAGKVGQITTGNGDLVDVIQDPRNVANRGCRRPADDEIGPIHVHHGFVEVRSQYESIRGG